MNFARRSACNKCGAARPPHLGPPPGRGRGRGDGPIGRGIRQVDPEKPRAELDRRDRGDRMPVPREGDWACPMCFNQNWAKRTECNVCNTPRPGTSAANERRDGRGGGFLERQETAAKSKRAVEDDDDEYDDFGRKKKKRPN
mmetsp:Transcript_22372/g.55114  ORF Transcript_22372/g.55114 Transcript_22372/m.55114 type:complete len:142 (-) Transcript_22372:202-627(-)